MTSTFAAETAAADPVADDGVVEALVAVTGVVDEVGDVIVPGAFKRTLARLVPKGVSAHDWKTRVARTLAARELPPGDPALPARTADGSPWPADAGALWVRGRYNLATPEGRTAYENAKFYGDEQAYSIGYKTVKSFSHRGIRFITDLDLYEWSDVLHGANSLARQLSVKSGRPAGMEFKALGRGVSRRRGTATISPDEVDDAERLAAGSEADSWAEVVERDIPYRLDSHATLQALPGRNDADSWVAIPCAACGSWAALLRGGLREGSGAVCRNCADTLGLGGARG